MEVLDLIILGLATQRLVAFWFGTLLFAKIRDTLAKRDDLIGIGANCGLCMSAWAGLLVYSIWFVPYGMYVLTALAIGSLAMLINSWSRS